MKLIMKVALVLLVSLTSVPAWILNGKVGGISQRTNGDVGVSFVYNNGLYSREKIILSDDVSKKEKLAILLTAKSMESDVAAEILDDETIGKLTFK